LRVPLLYRSSKLRRIDVLPQASPIDFARLRLTKKPTKPQAHMSIDPLLAT